MYSVAWDVSTDNWEGGVDGDHDPAIHALREFTAIFNRLRIPGGIVMVDDNMLSDVKNADLLRQAFSSQFGYSQPWSYDPNSAIRGKGRYVLDFMRTTNCEMLHYGWQIVWQC